MRHQGILLFSVAYYCFCNGQQPLDSDPECRNKVFNDALQRHNRIRQEHGVPPLSMSPELSQVASGYANVVKSKGRLEHMTNNPAGENLYSIAPLKSCDASGMMNAWYNKELVLYDFQQQQSKGGETGHMTQIIWEGTKEVGFGLSTDGRKVYIVAEYSPAGNVVGAFPSNVHPKGYMRSGAKSAPSPSLPPPAAAAPSALSPPSLPPKSTDETPQNLTQSKNTSEAPTAPSTNLPCQMDMKPKLRPKKMKKRPAMASIGRMEEEQKGEAKKQIPKEEQQKELPVRQQIEKQKEPQQHQSNEQRMDLLRKVQEKKQQPKSLLIPGGVNTLVFLVQQRRQADTSRPPPKKALAVQPNLTGGSPPIKEDSPQMEGKIAVGPNNGVAFPGSIDVES